MDSSTSSVRRPCFIEEDDGLASIAEFSGAGSHHHNLHQRRRPFFSRNGCYSAVSSSTVVPRRTGSLKNLNSLSTAPVSHCFSPRSGRISDSRFDEVNRMPHFLEACFLCKKPLGGNRDIFMYRGDTPFCSEECRTEQIEMDEAREKSLSLSASMKAMRSVQKDSTSAQENATSSPDKSQKYRFRAGTVAAA